LAFIYEFFAGAIIHFLMEHFDFGYFLYLFVINFSIKRC